MERCGINDILYKGKYRLSHGEILENSAFFSEIGQYVQVVLCM